MAHRPQSKTDRIRGLAESAKTKASRVKRSEWGEDTISKVVDAVVAKRPPMQSAPEIHVYAAPAPKDADSTPPVVKAAWRNREVLMRVLLWCLGAVGIGAITERVTGALAKLLE